MVRPRTGPDGGPCTTAGGSPTHDTQARGLSTLEPRYNTAIPLSGLFLFLSCQSFPLMQTADQTIQPPFQQNYKATFLVTSTDPDPDL